MVHMLVWDQNACDNSYLTHAHNMVFCVAIENLIQETDLWQNKISHPDSRYLYYVPHDTPYLSICFT